MRNMALNVTELVSGIMTCNPLETESFLQWIEFETGIPWPTIGFESI